MQRIERKHKIKELQKRYKSSVNNSPVKGRHGVRSPLSDDDSQHRDETNTPNARGIKSREMVYRGGITEPAA